MKRATLAAIGLGAVLQCSLAFAGEMLSGRPAVLDGDTLRLRGTVVGLYGIAAPGLAQTCESAKGRTVACGMRAAQALAGRIGEAGVNCEPRGVDAYRRTIAVCRVGSEDLSAWMVANGFAVADRLRTADYVADGAKAWAKRRGLWAEVFEDPTERVRDDYSAKVQVSALKK